MITFPLSLTANWQYANRLATLSAAEQDWLLEPGSLTAKLKSYAQHFAVKVLSEQPFDLSQSQQLLLKTTQSQALNREVLLLCDDQPMVYAQSWIPTSARLKQQNLLTMGTKPLGDVIFQDPTLMRTAIEVAQLDTDHSVQQLVTALTLSVQPLWARRSVFSLENNHFLVSEIFLPGAYIYL
ncbi:chorismate--pyruvate lyase family protein [Pseudoalteromonas mariniglutinosa]|uniref:chorismate--pyruvate lyase family protein n=1 Tax=Pseudoalteromonas mariniglutinosa TaxID=206042 RepID=UPI00384E39DD